MCLLSASATAAPGQDDALLGAYDAYRAGDALRYARHAGGLESHLLSPWLEYWRLVMRLEDAAPADVREFLAKHQGTYVAELLRGDWLKATGKRAQWAEFDREASAYPREDLEIRCYGWLSRLAREDEAALDEARAMWLHPEELPEGCARLADTLAARGRLSLTDIWMRVRVLFENGQITAAKTALAYLPRGDAPDERLLAEAARQPERFLARLPRTLERRATREVVVLAGLRHARNDPKAAAQALGGALGDRLPHADVQYLWVRVAHYAAREHLPEALQWYERAGDSPLDAHQLAWKARAALRAGDWRTVRDTIDRMPGPTRLTGTWTYWYGRSLAALGENRASRAWFLRIAGRPDFYGLLAAEELGYVITPPEEAYQPGENEVEAARATPALARALELIRLGIRTEGVREWLFAIRHFDDTRLLAAAELARREGAYDRAISTADRTEAVHNFALRYPTPFREVIAEYAKSQGLDEAWVMGLARQESRFIPEARSSAGAAGLMQVMPRTARFVAAKIGMRNYRPAAVTDVQTNVTLGTGYLRMVLDQLGHPVLASAAYNAGPARARRWREAERPLEGAIFAETIPFGETRDYVKKVTANAVFYAAVLENRATPIKELLGTISPRNAAEPAARDELP
ncbi:MAG TPA: transglycosylase SLT domain-containing protein [Burkholderiales bacterium]|nr:transglycosylase SLT domain-containing protein [Burkholderiales bacterium]